MNPGNLLCLPPSRLHASAMQPPTRGFAAVLRTPRTRDIQECAPNRRTSRSESGDPVCRLFRLSLSRLSLHLACAAKPLRGTHLIKGRSWRSRLRGTIISGRFRNRKLVASGGHSKCFFAAFLPCVNAPRSWPFPRACHNNCTRHAIKIGARRRGCKSRRRKQSEDGLRLAGAHFNDQCAARL
jgi:hypothetical protein